MLLVNSPRRRDRGAWSGGRCSISSFRRSARAAACSAAVFALPVRRRASGFTLGFRRCASARLGRTRAACASAMLALKDGRRDVAEALGPPCGRLDPAGLAARADSDDRKAATRPRSRRCRACRASMPRRSPTQRFSPHSSSDPATRSAGARAPQRLAAHGRFACHAAGVAGKRVVVIRRRLHDRLDPARLRRRGTGGRRTRRGCGGRRGNEEPDNRGDASQTQLTPARRALFTARLRAGCARHRQHGAESAGRRTSSFATGISSAKAIIIAPATRTPKRTRLRKRGSSARGATVYVSLEPCRARRSHAAVHARAHRRRHRARRCGNARSDATMAARHSCASAASTSRSPTMRRARVLIEAFARVEPQRSPVRAV